jgi:hypothetical protein
MLSMVSKAPTPHSPPMATPCKVRSANKAVSVGAKPDANSIAE